MTKLCSLKTCSFALAAIFLAPSPAEARAWWMIFAEGDKPERKVHYFDTDSMQTVDDPSRLMTISLKTKLRAEDLVDYYRIEGTTYFESADAPHQMSAEYRVRCRERQVASTNASQLWRDDRIVQLPSQPWTSADSSVLFSQLHTLVCDPKNRETNGMLGVTNEFNASDVTWEVFWADGIQPKWTSTRTDEERKAAFDAALASARATLAKHGALATDGLQKIKTDREQTIREQRKLFAQLGQKASPVLHSWMGLPESALVAGWGVPHQNFESDGSRFLYYAYGYTTMLVDQYGYEIPQETWACHMTFEIREGVVSDYRSHGNYCQTAAANLPYGRPREKAGEFTGD
jgi:hypothetical protein